MKIITNTQFAVPLFGVEFPGISDALDLENIVVKLCAKNEKEDPRYARKTWQVKQTNGILHEDKRLELLCESIISATNHISVNIMKYDPDYKVELTGMWGNIQRPGASLHKHRHHNTVFAGVIYINEINKTDGEFPAIQFFRPWDSQLQPSIIGDNIYNSTLSWISVQKDLTVIFPAWLEHKVPENLTNKNRISISFNIMLRGRYGSVNHLESTVF